MSTQTIETQIDMDQQEVGGDPSKQEQQIQVDYKRMMKERSEMMEMGTILGERITKSMNLYQRVNQHQPNRRRSKSRGFNSMSVDFANSGVLKNLDILIKPAKESNTPCESDTQQQHPIGPFVRRNTTLKPSLLQIEPMQENTTNKKRAAQISAHQ